MAKYYQDFVGLNTFIYEVNGYDISALPDLGGQPYEYVPSAGPLQPVSQNQLGSSQLSGDPTLVGRPIALQFFKNYSFSFDLPTTASFFPALMLHRNGPYGFPTWKQIRIGQNPLTRRQRKENVFTIVDPVGPEFEFKQGNEIRRGRARFGSILKYDECPLVSKYDPITLFGASKESKNSNNIIRLKVKSSLNNEISHFDNKSLNKKLGIVKAGTKNYDEMINLYLNGGLNSSESPIDLVEALKYKEAVYPPLLYTYKNYTRQRTTFVFPWRDQRSKRTESCVNPGFGFACITQSVWPMDASTGFATASNTSARLRRLYGLEMQNQNTMDTGILQNMYNSHHIFLPDSSSALNDRYPIAIAPIYSRKHMIHDKRSVVANNGMYIDGINTGTTMGDIDYREVPQGEAAWDAPAQSGKAPFHDSYEDYIQGARQLGKDFTIIPEFRISNHVSKYQTNGLNVSNPHFLELTGGLLNTTGSNETNFYTIFSNTDFLENFKMVKEQHKDIIDPVNIKLTFKGIKKLLPYEGFYPQQRTVSIAKQFYDSYEPNTVYSEAEGAFVEDDRLSIGFQNLLKPIAAPGILFNSIKSGVAVDYALQLTASNLDHNLIKSGSFGGGNSVYSDWYLRPAGSNMSNLDLGGGLGTDGKFKNARVFDYRVPFDALVEPEKYLSLTRLYNNEAFPTSNTSASCYWDGQGNNLYKLMTHNFLAETSNFFMKNKNYTTLYSKPSNNPGVGLAQAGLCYAMRIKMYKTAPSASLPVNFATSSGGAGTGSYGVPQYASSSFENFTMYSRPSAFGPPIRIEPITISQGINSIVLTGALATKRRIGPKTEEGEYYSHTPPYYYGQAWCDLRFYPTETRKYSIQEIIAQSTASYLRHIDPDIEPGANIFSPSSTKLNQPTYANNVAYNVNAMQLSASLNLFGLERDDSGDLNEETARWVIQTKFETPMLNFNHLSDRDSLTMPLETSQSVPRGMWHQYGNIETDTSKGIFLQIQDIPADFTENLLNLDPSLTGSMVDLVGFSSDPVRLGEIADSKEIREAVVAVPFIEETGEQKFFTLPREDINLALDPDRNDRVGISVKQMVQKMQRYVFPPSMDFIKNENIDPIAMYIFEFSHTLSKQDLADIWQGLYPDITTIMEEAQASISHNLLAHELIGGGAVRVNENDELFLDQGAKGNEFNDRLKWMVFKVKQKAEINYFNNIVTRGGDDFPGAIATSTGVNVDVSYNWPYDFFSLVELGKLESEVTLAKFKDRGRKALLEPVVPEPEIIEEETVFEETAVPINPTLASTLASTLISSLTPNIDED